MHNTMTVEQTAKVFNNTNKNAAIPYCARTLQAAQEKQ